jgi:hypothetical protein
MIDMEMRTLVPGSEWMGYYADWFLARYAALVDAEATKTP